MSKEPDCKLEMVHFDLWSENSKIAAGKELAFRFTFRNKGPGVAYDVRIITVISQTTYIPPLEVEKQMIGSFKGAVMAQRQQQRMIGPTVNAGDTTFVDVKSDKLSQQQAHALIQGTGRYYQFFWAEWKDAAGNSGEVHFALWLNKPKGKSVLTPEEMKWEVLPLPTWLL